MMMEFQTFADCYRGNTTSTVVEIDGAGNWRSMTHAELGALAQAREKDLIAAGVRPGHVIGIQATNSIDWLAWDLAALSVSAVLQALPDEMDVNDVDEFLSLHGLALLVTERLSTTYHDSVLTPSGAVDGLVVAPNARTVDIPDLHSMVYSSGTTGKLKGLLISRKGTEYVINRFIESFPVSGDDCHLIFLPLANYQQRLSAYCCLWLGADLVLAPYQRVFRAIKTERPTFLIAPPVFYETVLQLARTSTGGEPLADFLGGRMRFMITGMAPMRLKTLEAFWAADVQLFEAYGLTETGMIAWNTDDAYRFGSVGKLIDPDAVEFLSDGELLIRRPAPLSIGYFDADAPHDVFREDGSIATGDYGRMDDDGYLFLVGRKNDVIVLGSGRKVHPVEVEADFAGIAGVAEIVVIPTPENGQLGAIVTPTASDEQLRTAIQQRIEQVNGTLDAHRRVGPVVFVEQPLRISREFMTANMKLSRRTAAEFFANELAKRTSR